MEMLKVSSIKRLVDNRIYKINPQNNDLGDLPFDGDKRMISSRLIFCRNNKIVFG